MTITCCRSGPSLNLTLYVFAGICAVQSDGSHTEIHRPHQQACAWTYRTAEGQKGNSSLLPRGAKVTDWVRMRLHHCSAEVRHTVLC